MNRVLWLIAALWIGCSASRTISPDAATVPDASSEADAESAEACTEENATRAAACGNCGLGSQVCRGGFWTADGVCLDEGECAPGATEARDTPMCGQEMRICDAACAWRNWSRTREDRECEAGTTRIVEGGACGEGSWVENCTAECAWDASTCGDPCMGLARTSPWDAEEVCVAGGPFIRGSDLESPIAEVRVSTFLVDRYPVTVRRYLECIDAEMCDLPGSNHISWWREAERAEYPMFNLSYRDATKFCAWDGGRRLLTEAEWEKTARGPAPRDQDYLWGDEPSCERLDLCEPPAVNDAPSFSVRSLPDASSYYQAELMIGGVFEWVSDYYSRTYYADPSSLEDPRGPAEPERIDSGGVGRTYRVQRGFYHQYWSDETFHVSWRTRATADETAREPWFGIRCGRSVTP